MGGRPLRATVKFLTSLLAPVQLITSSPLKSLLPLLSYTSKLFVLTASFSGLCFTSPNTGLSKYSVSASFLSISFFSFWTVIYHPSSLDIPVSLALPSFFFFFNPSSYFSITCFIFLVRVLPAPQTKPCLKVSQFSKVSSFSRSQFCWGHFWFPSSRPWCGAGLLCSHLSFISAVLQTASPPRLSGLLSPVHTVTTTLVPVFTLASATFRVDSYSAHWALCQSVPWVCRTSDIICYSRKSALQITYNLHFLPCLYILLLVGTF